jgi:hypothetical protein
MGRFGFFLDPFSILGPGKFLVFGLEKKRNCRRLRDGVQTCPAADCKTRVDLSDKLAFISAGALIPYPSFSNHRYEQT